MGRKALRKERRKEILDAFEKCIVEFGLSAATLTRVAEKAQVNRGMIHHYFGDRNALLSALIEDLVGSYREGFSKSLDVHKDESKIETIVKYFFEEWSGSGPNDDVTIDALVAEAGRDSHIQKIILDIYLMMENAIAIELKELYPNAAIGRCENVAYAFMSMAYGSSTMMWLGFDRKRVPALRSLAKNLIQTLEEDV